jgi:hypothetical protein
MTLNFRSSGTLRRVGLYVVTDVSVRPIGPIFKDKVICLFFFFYVASLTLVNGEDRLFLNVGNQLPINPAYIPVGQMPQLHHDRSPRSGITHHCYAVPHTLCGENFEPTDGEGTQ